MNLKGIRFGLLPLMDYSELTNCMRNLEHITTKWEYISDTKIFWLDFPTTHRFVLISLCIVIIYSFFFYNHPLSYPIGIYSICSITQCDTHSGILLVSFTYLNVFLLLLS